MILKSDYNVLTAIKEICTLIVGIFSLNFLNKIVWVCGCVGVSQWLFLPSEKAPIYTIILREFKFQYTQF